MIKYFFKPAVIFFNMIYALSLASQVKYCENIGFENGDFKNWQGFTWVNSTIPSVQSTNPAPGFSMQTIMSDTSSYDSNTGYGLKKIPPGFRYSARLGDLVKNTSVATLRYSLTLDSSNALLIYKFAVVLLNPTSGHEKFEEPRFKVTLYDDKNFLINDCSNYDVFASDAELNKSFKTYYPSANSEPVLWRDWTTVGVNLSAYIGKTVTIEFLAADCTHKGHYGYAYFVASCQPPVLNMKFCYEDSIASLTAPNGFESYNWTDPIGNFVSNTQQVSIINAPENSVYTCNMTSATGCKTSMSTKIHKYKPIPDFKSEMLDCHSNKVQFINNSVTNYGHLNYTWDFGDGNFSYETNPAHTFSTSGLHKVTLTVLNEPSSCIDTLIRTVESFAPPLVGITGPLTYCPGGKTTINAYGAAIYNWSNGSKSEVLEIGAPGGDFWMIGKSTTGCFSDTIFFKIIEEPDWKFEISGDNSICQGDTVELIAEEAISYKWNTGATSPIIFVSNEGIYSVSGINARGCNKTVELFVKVNPIPFADFNIDPMIITKAQNKIRVSVWAQNSVEYFWNFGDGKTGKGSELFHEYDVNNSLKGYYVVKLTAVSNENCTDTLIKKVVVYPTIPDIFTPDNDGLNDMWKVELSEYFDKSISAAIFDRWGEKMIEWNDSRLIEWNGRFRGVPVNPGVYVYLIRCETKSGEEAIFSGNVTVIR